MSVTAKCCEMEESPSIEHSLKVSAEWGEAGSMRDRLVTDCLRAIHASKPLIPGYMRNFAAWLHLSDSELENYVRRAEQEQLTSSLLFLLLS